ncbi:bifunctional folylpolyglutamate synthase/dihydrofolate synthase [Salegentibacter sp. JZCK2]|uniref:bifunctional folylpolyglutamate synthase/dihydrofolate synthase n=1 Tax=Salegentibacter tibetensis TaxID=2873600 RepID=UPI001CCBE892|nr:folylpolyglutamate synthase/dihydrofolate synthase family protein [Salegentibacter tibetensis]MBZ9728575.1 bifunctional folylpolyglutamate synthase/dihydrofolate synthase [Salegentibacter tibetensis]
MFQQLPMYQRVGAQAFKKDLSRTIKLAEHLGNPHKEFKSVHIAGTNGKGSTSHMLASVLQEAGYKVGLYTSPHLKDFRERIKVNGEFILKKTVTGFINEHKDFLTENKFSFFEMTVGMAFDHFARVKVDIAIIEVGLGGRLDSTNIITPEVSVITNIGLDHTAFLGDTLPEIASEKAGIIKDNIPVIIGEKQKETTKIFTEKAQQHNSEIYFAQDLKLPKYHTDLKGDYQNKNIKSVIAAVKVLREKGWEIPEECLKNGLNSVKLHTSLQGRWDILKEKPKVICDTAHNTEGLTLVFKQLKKEKFQHLHIVLGVVNDKDLNKILPLFPKTAIYYFSKPEVPRGLEAEILQEKAAEFSLEGRVFNSVSEAYDSAVDAALDEDLVFVGGSTFTVAEII